MEGGTAEEGPVDHVSRLQVVQVLRQCGSKVEGGTAEEGPVDYVSRLQLVHVLRQLKTNGD